MAKLLLVSCNTVDYPYPVYPLGLSMLASVLSDAGHDVLIFDPLYEPSAFEGLAERLAEFGPDIVGLSIRNIDNLNYTNRESYTDIYSDIVRRIRKNSDAFVVLGGSGFTIFPERLLEETGADYGITGEGERAFCELVSGLERGELPRQRIISASGHPGNLCLGSGTREPILADFYLKNGGMLNVQSKRGCPHRCAYCSYPHLEGGCYRYRPAEEVADEIAFLKNNCNCDYVFITDSVFNDDGGRYLELVEEMLRRDIGISWSAFFRPAEFDAGTVDLLKHSGLKTVEWGTDCSTDTTLRAMRKGFNWDIVVESNEKFSSAGIASSHFIIFGGPGETPETFEEGLKNSDVLKDCVIFASTGVRILPGTAVYDLALEQGVVGIDTDLLKPVYYFSPALEPEFIHERLISHFRSRMDRIYPWDKISRDIIKALHASGRRGPGWDFLLKASS